MAILLVWIVALGLLVRREFWRPAGERLAAAALTLPPGATYFRVTLGNAQIGYASTVVDTLPDTLRVTENVVVDVPVLGEVQRTEVHTEIEASRTLTLRSFTAMLRGPDARFAASGQISGDTLLELQVTGDDRREVRHVRLTGPIVLPQLLPFRLAFGGRLSAGRTHEVRLFDPEALTLRDVAIEVAAESTLVVPKDTAVFDSTAARWIPVAFDTVKAWRVREAGHQFPGNAWIDDRGQIVSAWTAGGVRFERSAYELAYENYRLSGGNEPDAVSPHVIRSTAAAAGVRLVPESLTTLTVRLGGQPLDGLDLEGDGQRLAGDTVVVRSQATRVRAGYRLPYTESQYQRFVDAEPLIESDDPRIQAQARQIIRSTRRPATAAARLNAWVHAEIANAGSFGVPSALDAYLRRRGDCNEHTVLYVALARAIGLPARTAAGLVYLDGSFYYHAWPEVWLGRWVAADPTLGQFPADAAHLRLIVGGLARQLELVRLVGQLRITVVAMEPVS